MSCLSAHQRTLCTYIIIQPIHIYKYVLSNIVILQQHVSVTPVTIIRRSYTRAVRRVSSHFEYLENLSVGLDVTWQPAREDLTAHP